jgi:hypothetical protein
MAKQDDWVRLTVRMPPELYARLQQAVAEGPNSMNAEVVTRLESTFRAGFPGGRPRPEAVDDMRAAALMFYEAAEMARTKGGKISLELKVEGIDDEATHNEISDKALDAIAGTPHEPKPDPKSGS